MKLSIIIPTYNVEEYLAKCLDSVIYPQLTDYEIIIVNDGSTDRSLAVAEEYRSKYPSLIRIISQENGGLGAARNTGIEAAAGEYLIFLDSDDSLAENAVTEILARLNEDFDLCVFGMISVNENGEEVNKIPVCTRDGVFDLEAYPELLLSAHSACNKICRRSLFIAGGIRFPGRVWYEDMRTMPKLYLLSEKICTDPRRWYVYLQRSGSITNNANVEKNLQIIDAADDLISYYKSAGVFDQYKEELEYSVFFHQLLTASVRVCVVSAGHPALKELREDYIKKFPDFQSNKYIKNMPLKYRLLSRLILAGRTGAVKLIMTVNNQIKNKNT